MTIADLKTSVTEMNPEQGLELVLERRDSRLTPKKRSSRKKKHEPISLQDTIDMMNVEQMEGFLEKLEGKMKS